MPPKESKEVQSEIAEVINRVKSYWPDYVINSELLLHPTTEFVTKFYSDVLADLNEKICDVLNEDVTGNDLDSKEFNYEVNLFCAMSRFFRKLKVDAFCINDIYRPVPKRTRFFIRTAVHFLIYTTNFLPDLQTLTDDIFKQMEEKEKLLTEKQELLHQIAQLAENVAKAEKEHKTLLIERETVSNDYEKMLNEKHEQEKINMDLQLQIEKLFQECEMAEYQLACAEKEEATLKEQLITEKDYEGLKNMEKALQAELERLSTEDVGIEDGLGAEKENLDSMESCVNSLAKIHLESLSKKVYTLRELEDSKKETINENACLSDEIKRLQADVEKMKRHIEILNEKLMVTKKESTLLQKQVEVKLNQLKHAHERQEDSTSAKLEKCKEYKAKIDFLRNELDSISHDKQYFKEVCATEFKKILDKKRELLNEAIYLFCKLRDDSIN